MKLRRFALVSCLLAVLAAAIAPASAIAPRDVVDRLGSVTIDSEGRIATLVDIHHINPVRLEGKPAGSANCSNDGAATGKYELVGWQVGLSTFHYNEATTPAGLGSQTAVMQAAFNAWPSPAPRVNVLNDGTATRYGATRTGDIMFGSTGGSLATTYTWRWNDGLVESDVVFNKGYTWFNAGSEGDGCIETAGNTYDVRNIATHEFGHVYGLGHPSGARYETMYAYGYSGETLKWSPASGDANGVNANY